MAAQERSKNGSTSNLREELHMKGGVTTGEGDQEIPAAIFFLIKEQAKSVVAVQELEKRMLQMERMQDAAIVQMHNIQRQLISSPINNFLRNDVKSCMTSGDQCLSCPNSQHKQVVPHPLTPDCILQCVSLPTCEDGCRRINEAELHKLHGLLPEAAAAHTQSTYSNQKSTLPNKMPNYTLTQNIIKPNHCMEGCLKHSKNAVEKDKLATQHDSDKQDSGVDSDCRDQGQEPGTLPPLKNNTLSASLTSPEIDDELMGLLEQIEKKALVLQNQLECNDCDSQEAQDVVNSLENKVDDKGNLFYLLNEMESKNKRVEKKLMEQEVQRRKLEEKLQMTLAEIQQVKSELFSNSSDADDSQNSLHHYTDLNAFSSTSPFNLIHHSNESEINSKTCSNIAAIFKEKDVSLLRSFLLSCITENEALQTKVRVFKELCFIKVKEKERLECAFKENMWHNLREKKEFIKRLEECNVELMATKSKVKMLENILHMITVSNKVNMQLGPNVNFQNFAPSKCAHHLKNENLHPAHLKMQGGNYVSKERKVELGNESFADIYRNMTVPPYTCGISSTSQKIASENLLQQNFECHSHNDQSPSSKKSLPKKRILPMFLTSVMTKSGNKLCVASNVTGYQCKSSPIHDCVASRRVSCSHQDDHHK